MWAPGANADSDSDLDLTLALAMTLSSRTLGLGQDGTGVGGGIAGFVFFLISALVRAWAFLFLQLHSLPSILPSVQTSRQMDSPHLIPHSPALGKIL